MDPKGAEMSWFDMFFHIKTVTEMDLVTSDLSLTQIHIQKGEETIGGCQVATDLQEFGWFIKEKALPDV